MFLGTTFFSGKYTYLSPAINIKTIKDISITDGKYDHLYISANPNKTSNNINEEWDNDTRLNASFDRNFEAGSLGFSAKNTDTVVIKTREKGSFDWKTIYVVPIKTNDDFNFIKVYPYSKNLSDNEYMMVSQINGIENSYVVTEEKTEFEGYFVVDKENVYGTMFNMDFTDTTQNINNTVLELLNSKYATVYTNSDTNYASGTTSGCFLKFNDDNCTINAGLGVKHRQEVMQWLCNNKAKVLKLQDGRIYLINVVGKPTDTNEGHEDLRRITFEWVEIGDVDDERTLYMNNLSDVPEAFW